MERISPRSGRRRPAECGASPIGPRWPRRLRQGGHSGGGCHGGGGAPMSQRHPLALVAGASTLLAALPLTTVFASFTWLFSTAIGIAMITGTAMLVRSLRGPLWAQVLAMAGVLMLYLTWAFPSGD